MHAADLEPLPPLHRIAILIVIVLPFAGLIAAIALMWGYGFHWVDLWLLLGMYVATALGITVGFHRLFTHRSFATSRPVQALFGVLGSMAVEGPLLRWVAMHRCHHRFSDEEGDPHSPHCHGTGLVNILRGAWRAHVGWLMEPLPPDLEARYVSDLSGRRLVRVVDRLFPVWVAAGILIPGVVAGLISMSWTGALLGMLWGGLVRIFFVQHVTWSINSVCHIWGTRPYDCRDQSRNNALFGVLAFGEGWHNNHHAFPTSARHGLRWWELDVSYLVIRLMARLRIAWQVRVPTPQRLEAKRGRVAGRRRAGPSRHPSDSGGTARPARPRATAPRS